MWVQVSLKHIRAARRSKKYCPLHFSISDLLLPNLFLEVFRDRVVIYSPQFKNVCCRTLPAMAVDFLKKYDNHEKVTAISFELHIDSFCREPMLAFDRKVDREWPWPGS